ncbi:hypothetical protein [Labrys sp. 22185]|uniref:hypothetical protein n=1 Tax=Labrys sp. 22185 TaxID=3453888 RepID=UPI003F87CC1E
MAVALGRKTFALGFPLRAALRLVRCYPAPLDLLQALAECNTSAMAQVISECSGTRYSPEQLFDDLAPANRGMQLRTLAGMLGAHVASLLTDGLDIKDDEPAKEPQKPVKHARKLETRAEGYEALYEIAGGIGWPPNDIWNASPSEILRAAKGRGELIGDILKAVFGSADDEPDNDNRTYDPARDDGVFDREGLQALKGMGKW